MKLKIAVVGPSQSGKTSLTNVLGKESITVENSTSGSKIPYYPTRAVRIVDLSMTVILGSKKQKFDTEVQLWEVGGDPRLKTIWPGIQKDSDGIIIMYKTLEESQVNDASALHMQFLTHSNSGLSPAQCLIIGNNFRGMRELGPQKIIGISQRVRHIAVNVEDDTNYLREEFNNFITGVAQIIYEKERLH